MAYFTVYKYNDSLYQIKDALGSLITLVIGEEKALVFDTGYGIGDLKKQIEELQAEYNQLDMMQEQYEASIKIMTGGYGTEDLVEKVVENTNSTDKNGNIIKITKYVLKYPGTIIPVPVEDLDNVTAEEVDEEDTIDYTTINEQ